MNDDYDIDYLTRRKPVPDAPSQTSTDYARASLIAHGRRTRRRRRVAATLQVGAAVGVIAAAIMVLGPSAHHSPTRAATPAALAPTTPPRAHHAHAVARTPLMKLAADVRTMPSAAQPGDATLVVRYTAIDGRHTIDGAVYGGYDLYTDAGQYYYAPDSLAQLQQTVDSHQAVGGPSEAQMLSRLAAVAGGTPAAARAATLSQSPGYAGPIPPLAEQHRIWADQPPILRQRFPFHPYTAESWRQRQDSVVYIVADQALQAGAGRADVRAAAMKALSTLQGVTQTPTTVDGVKALEVDFPITGGPEIVWLDAATGVPIQEKDGNDSATAYSVERVTASDLPSTVSPSARLR